MLLHDVFYRSNEQFHVRFVDHERKEEPYYLYYYFRPDGIWLCKTEEASTYDLVDFLASLDLAEVLHDPHHTEPMNAKNELLYQSGTYELRNESVYLTWRNGNLEEKERTWYFRIKDENYLHTDFEEFILEPQH